MTLRGDIESQTDGWLALANKCLQLIEARSDCVNVIVTQTQVRTITIITITIITITIITPLYFQLVAALTKILVRPGPSVPCGECLLRHQDRKGRLLRADHAEVWQEIHLRCDW